MGILFKKPASVTHNYIWAPNTMVSFRKSFTPEGRTPGQTDRQAIFHITLLAMATGLKREFTTVQKQYPVDL